MDKDKMSQKISNNDESSPSSAESLPYSWLISLDSTLNNAQGTKALESYLVHQNSISLLEFIWACDGMKSLVEENPENVEQLVSCIYKNYIISGLLPILSDKVVITIVKILENHFEQPEPSDSFSLKNQNKQDKKLKLDIFDEAKAEVESHLREIVFPQFKLAVSVGSVYVGEEKPPQGKSHEQTKGQLASQPEIFARALCKKLESLQVKRRNESF